MIKTITKSKIFIAIIVVGVIALLVSAYLINERRKLIKYAEKLPSMNAEDVIKDHFKRLNDHNSALLKLTHVERKGIKVDYNLKNINYARLISIVDSTNKLDKSPYHEYFDVKSFDAKYDIAYSKPTVEDSGQYIARFIVVKETKSSSWKILDIWKHFDD